MADHLDTLKAVLAARYAIEREIGRGGMACVYLARDLKHRRRVAIKVLHPAVASALGPDRFLREIEIAAGLSHPHILPVFDSGQAADLLYYVMPYVEGESLRERLERRRPFAVREAVRILCEILEALSKAHAAGVVHRDIKPGNVMLSDGHALVMDFGVAKASSGVSGGDGLTGTGIALGTPTYMSPEQAAGDPHVDHRSDIYSVGVVAYELLTGHVPFQDVSAHRIAAAHLTQEPRPLSHVRPDVPPVLATAIMKCLNKDPDDRWQTAAELLNTIYPLSISDAHATTLPATRRSIVFLARHWPKLAAVLVLLLLVTLGERWRRSRAAPITSTADPQVVAVLPFRVSGADPRLWYLREGMVDLLWARLTGEGGPRAADPTAVLQTFDRLAASPSSDLSEPHVILLGQRVGAGQVLSGAIVGTPDRLVISATVTPVVDQVARAQASVEGPSDSLVSMVDRLAGQLLARGAGFGEGRAFALAAHPLSAVQDYLAGRARRRLGHYEQAVEHFQSALTQDSTFTLAALEILLIAGWVVVPNAWEIRDQVWQHRDQLSERDRLLLEVRGLLPGVPRTVAERLALAERAVSVMPSDPELWEIVADLYFHRGEYLGISDAWQRADAGFRRALAIDSSRAGPLQHVIQMLAVAGDTTELPTLATRYFQQDSTSELSLFLQWLVAVVRGDSVRRRHVREIFDSTAYLGIQVADLGESHGLGLDDVDEALAASRRRAATDNQRLYTNLKSSFRALNKGHPSEAEVFLHAVDSKGTRMMAALFWDGDTAAAQRVAHEVEALAREPLPDDRATRSLHGRAICLAGLWQLAHDDTTRAVEHLDRLKRESPAGDTTALAAAKRTCAVLLDASLASDRNEDRALALIERLDSLARRGPVFWEVIPLNLIIARLFERHGEYARALAAARRRPYWYGTFSGNAFLTAFLETEGRVAALVGDTAAAVDAYQLYLSLRSDPEPHLADKRKAIGADLARFVGEP